MSSFEIQFLSFLVIVILVFALFILFLLKQQEKSLKKNLLLKSDDVWNLIQNPSQTTQLSHQNLLFGILQQPNYTEISFILKNYKDEIIGELISPMIKRRKSLTIEGNNYVMLYPLTWKRTIVLKKEMSQEVLATYIETGWLGKHKIQTLNDGNFISSNASIDFRGTYTYSHEEKNIGFVTKTFAGNSKGRLAVLPDTLPLEIRLFMLLC